MHSPFAGFVTDIVDLLLASTQQPLIYALLRSNCLSAKYVDIEFFIVVKPLALWLQNPICLNGLLLLIR